MVSRLISVAMVGGMALGLAACGSTGTAATGSAASGQPFSIQATEYQFIAPTLTLPANTSVSLTIKNVGTVHHNFSVKELGVNQDVETPGDSKTVTFTTKSDATYTFFCEYHGTSKGMKGTLIVGTGGAGASGASGATGAASPSAAAAAPAPAASNPYALPSY